MGEIDRRAETILELTSAQTVDTKIIITNFLETLTI